MEGDVVGEEHCTAETSQQTLQQFWSKVTDDIKKVTAVGTQMNTMAIYEYYVTKFSKPT